MLKSCIILFIFIHIQSFASVVLLEDSETSQVIGSAVHICSRGGSHLVTAAHTLDGHKEVRKRRENISGLDNFVDLKRELIIGKNKLFPESNLKIEFIDRELDLALLSFNTQETQAFSYTCHNLTRTSLVKNEMPLDESLLELFSKKSKTLRVMGWNFKLRSNRDIVIESPVVYLKEKILNKTSDKYYWINYSVDPGASGGLVKVDQDPYADRDSDFPFSVGMIIAANKGMNLTAILPWGVVAERVYDYFERSESVNQEVQKKQILEYGTYFKRSGVLQFHNPYSQEKGSTLLRDTSLNRFFDNGTGRLVDGKVWLPEGGTGIGEGIFISKLPSSGLYIDGKRDKRWLSLEGQWEQLESIENVPLELFKKPRGMYMKENAYYVSHPDVMLPSLTPYLNICRDSPFIKTSLGQKEKRSSKICSDYSSNLSKLNINVEFKDLKISINTELSKGFSLEPKRVKKSINIKINDSTIKAKYDGHRIFVNDGQELYGVIEPSGNIFIKYQHHKIYGDLRLDKLPKPMNH